MSQPESHHLSDDELVGHVEAKLGGVDKSTWGDGPWQSEPDEEDFDFAGFRCHIRRHSDGGNFVAYVAIPSGHPWRSMTLDEYQPEFHGGITFTGTIKEIYGDEYLIGGDFNHSNDFAPAFSAWQDRKRKERGEPPSPFSKIGRYKDIEYVRGQVQQLAFQAKEAW